MSAYDEALTAYVRARTVYHGWVDGGPADVVAAAERMWLEAAVALADAVTEEGI